MGKIAYAVLSGAFGVLSIITFAKYISSPELKNLALIKDEAAYIHEYRGSRPVDAIDHVLASVDQLELSNPSNDTDIQDLETELMQYRLGLEAIDNPRIYNPVLDTLSDQLQEFAAEHNKDESYLSLGMMSLFWSGIFGMGSARIHSSKNKS